MALAGSVKAAFVMSLAPTGITAETYAPSLVALRAEHPSDGRLRRVQRTADAYVAAWGNQDHPAAATLYAPTAHITDDLLGVAATGIDEVRALASASPARGSLDGAALVALPDLGGPALFAAGGTDPDDPLDTVVLLVTTDRGCASHVAVVLHLDDDGRIVEEGRHHSAADIGGCAVPRVSVGPWWDKVAIPPGISDARSGTLSVQGRTIEVRSSSPSLDRLLEWGMGRFAAADLSAPVVDSVTFVSPSAPACARINGLAWGEDVALCFGTSDACTDNGCAGWRPWVKRALLHELSHLWISQNVSPEVQVAFVRSAALPTWAADDSPWGKRGVELAAETMAGTLIDEPVALNAKLDRRSCADLAGLYTLLTGVGPPAGTQCGEP